MRRSLPFLFALLAALGGCGWGVFALQRIFAEEREEALDALEARRREIERGAAARLKRELEAGLASARARVEIAREDPLAPAQGLYLFESGQRVLPRIPEHRPPGSTRAAEILAALRQGQAPAAGGEEGDRMALAARVITELGAGRTDAGVRAFQEYLGHRMHFRLPADRDLAAHVAALEALHREGSPRHALMTVGSSRVDLQACKLEYSIVSPK